MNTTNTEVSYCITYGNMIVDGIHLNGNPIISGSHFLRFPSESAAYTFLDNALTQAVIANLPDLDIMHFPLYSIEIREQRFHKVRMDVAKSTLSWYLLDSSFKPDEEKKSLLRLAVLYGFSAANVDDNFLDIVLTSPKYHDIVKQVIPPHMIENKELFMHVGVKTCSKEELGAIMLTSSDDLLKYIDVDRYNISR